MLANPLESRLAQFHDEFNTLIDRFWNKSWSDHFGNFGWGLDVDDNDREYVIRAQAPGFEAEDFDVQVRGNHLVIRAQHQEERDGKNGSHRHFGHYHQSVPLPYGVQSDKIDARYRSGILELHVPKSKEGHGKRITVEAK
jgi:HSP20 family protein